MDDTVMDDTVMDGTRVGGTRVGGTGARGAVPVWAGGPAAVLEVRGPDRRGLVAEVAGAVAAAGANIDHADQHLDRGSGLFVQRLELDTTECLPGELERHLGALSGPSGLGWQLADPARPTPVALMVSNTAHCPADLLARVEAGELNAEVRVMVSDRADLGRLAERHGVEFHHVAIDPADRRAHFEAAAAVVEASGAELVVLARYMRVLPGWFVDRWPQAMINIHHSFLPAFAGSAPYRRAHDRGVKLVGATAHYVTEELDAGPIIAQDVVAVTHRDTVEDLTRRGADVERVVLARAVRLHLERRVAVVGDRTVVFGA